MGHLTQELEKNFDKHLKDQKTYFTNNDSSSNVIKTFTKSIYRDIAAKNQTFEKPENIVEVEVVKGSHLLATPIVNPYYITKALYKKDVVPTTYFTEPFIEEKVEFDYFILNDEITFIFKEETKDNTNTLFDVEKILNGKNIYIDIYMDGIYKETLKCEKIKTIKLNDSLYNFDIYYKYENGMLDGIKNSLQITYN